MKKQLRFKQAKQLLAYIGLNPKVRQNGHSLNSIGRLTKRGSLHSKRAIFLASYVIRRYDKHCKGYFEKERRKDKSYRVANLALARKMLLIVKVIWLSGGTYDLDLW